MGGIANVALQAVPAVASVQKVVKSFTADTKADRAAREKALAREAEARAEEAEKEAEARRDEAALRDTQALAMRQLVESQEAELRAKQADIDTKRAQISASAAADETSRRDALRRAVARTRASLGAGGGGSADGSGEALLLGLVAESDRTRQDSAAVDRLREQALNQELADARQGNLLERSQLADRQRLQLLAKGY